MNILGKLKVGENIKMDDEDYKVTSISVTDDNLVNIDLLHIPKPVAISFTGSIIDNPYYDNKQN